MRFSCVQASRQEVLFWKKEPKNFYPFASVPMDESLFASFSSEKEDAF